jgi:hypothetical protein
MLVFFGGVIVLFIYISTLALNEEVTLKGFIVGVSLALGAATISFEKPSIRSCRFSG